MDDATGTVANALFRPEGGTRVYFLLMDGVIRCYFIPWLSTATATVSLNSMTSQGTYPPVCPTQFTGAKGELGIEQIFARSPQAKGRV